MCQTDPQVFSLLNFLFFRDNAVEIKCHWVMVSCCHINAIVKPIIYFIIICFMENKYWSNPKMFISKVEDIDPVAAFHYDVFTSIIMPNDWWVANWIIFSYGKNAVEWFSHNTGCVEFLSVLLCGQFRLPSLFTERIKKHLISGLCRFLLMFCRILYILHSFSMPSHSMLMRRVEKILFCC